MWVKKISRKIEKKWLGECCVIKLEDVVSRVQYQLGLIHRMIIYCLNHASSGVRSCHSILLLRNMQWLKLRIIWFPYSGIQGSVLISPYTSLWVPCSGHNWFDLMGQAETFYNYLLWKTLHRLTWFSFFNIKICLFLVNLGPNANSPITIPVLSISPSCMHCSHTSWTSVLHLGDSFTGFMQSKLVFISSQLPHSSVSK